jgi:hypothetical protein
MIRSKVTLVGKLLASVIGGLMVLASTNTSAECLAIKSIGNDKWVTARIDYIGDRYGMVRASANQQDTWERFDGSWPFYVANNGLLSLKSRANGRYVTSEILMGDYYNGMLRAERTSARDWEIFEPELLSEGSGYAIFVMKARANGKYVSAELGYRGDDYGMLRASRSWKQTWEQFRMNKC